MSAFIKVRNVSLSVPRFVQRERSGRHWIQMMLGAAIDPPKREFTTLLDHIDFELNEGDRLAILGRNGAGKSTLLRVLNGVYAPSAGTVDINGTCQALLNVSLGFIASATVRENVLLRGNAMRIPTSRLRDHIDEILEFAGLTAKANHRLHTLSSGQRMRLGFSISTCFQHDIMLMDEWVGAGDAQFMQKAAERMRSRVGSSRIVALASHSTGLLRDICNRGIVIERGRLLYAGDIVASLKYYHDLLADLKRSGHEIESTPPGGLLTYGCIETIRWDGRQLHAVGWMVDAEGRVPDGLALEVAGDRFMAVSLEHQPRPDVQRHMGLSVLDSGFKASFDIPELAERLAEGGTLGALGGARGAVDSPLRIGPAVPAALRELAKPQRTTRRTLAATGEDAA